MGVWRTKDGREISYSELDDKHLLNILKWIERKAETGYTETVMQGAIGEDDYDLWEETIEYHGIEVLNHFNYRELAEEAIKRGIITREEIEQRVARYIKGGIVWQKSLNTASNFSGAGVSGAGYGVRGGRLEEF